MFSNELLQNCSTYASEAIISGLIRDTGNLIENWALNLIQLDNYIFAHTQPRVLMDKAKKLNFDKSTSEEHEFRGQSSSV